MMTRDGEFLTRVRSESQKTMAEVIDADEVVLIDYPAYHNVGDHLIWLGELAYLSALDIEVRLQADERSYAPAAISRLPREVPILLTGGGNFGDVWPARHAFRKRVLSDHPGRRIVQLPQSVYFTDGDRAASSNRMFGAHSDFTLMLRDSESLARSRAELPAVRTVSCADMALGWQPDGQAAPEPDGYVLVLARRDAEAKQGQGSVAAWAPALGRAIGAQIVVADWGLTGLHRVPWDVARIPARLGHEVPWIKGMPGYHTWSALGFEMGTAKAVKEALRLFRGARAILTDRLHAHVLAGLMGIPHVVVDNSYGKVGAIFRDYTHEFAAATFASSIDEAIPYLEK